jgi:hypothetical protein
MQPTNTLTTLRYLQNKIRLIRAIHLYKLKFEELSAEEERSTRLELSNYDLLQEEMEEHILALTGILKFLKEGKSEKENEKLIREILSQLPQITKEMHLFVKSLDTHSQNINHWLKTIAPEIPQKNIHLYRRSTATSQNSPSADSSSHLYRRSTATSQNSPSADSPSHLYRPSTATSHDFSTASSQADNQKKSTLESKEEEKKKILESFNHYALSLQLIANS